TSSSSSRASARVTVSPASILPPGNSHSPAPGVPERRRAINTRPSWARTMPTATCKASSGSILGIDAHVFVTQIAGINTRADHPPPQANADGVLGTLHDGRAPGVGILRVRFATTNDAYIVQHDVYAR